MTDPISRARAVLASAKAEHRMALAERVARPLLDVLEAANEIGDHAEDCRHLSPTRGCTCGYEALRNARDEAVEAIATALPRGEER